MSKNQQQPDGAVPEDDEVKDVDEEEAVRVGRAECCCPSE
jgi:hypothetical protein